MIDCLNLNVQFYMYSPMISQEKSEHKHIPPPPQKKSLSISINSPTIHSLNPTPDKHKSAFSHYGLVCIL